MEIVKAGHPREPTWSVVVRRHELKLLRNLLLIDESVDDRQRDDQGEGWKWNWLPDGGGRCQSDVELDIEALLTIRTDRDQLAQSIT